MATEQGVRFLDIDVLTAARQRVRHALTSYDEVIVSFSGGKDSLVVVWLTRQIMNEMGIKRPLKLMFRDEEVIPDPVIEFVQSYHERAGFELYYYAVPMKSHIYMLGEHWPYVQWDPAREWVRQPPSYAVRQLHPTNEPMDQHEMNGLTIQHMGLRGKVAILNGIRADESITRFRAVSINKGPHPEISGDPAGAKNIDFVKPIYDWNQTDLFKFFKESEIEYASIYNMQLWAEHPLRVATPLHDRAYQSIVKMRSMYPTFYSQMLAIWPEVATHERYWKDVDQYGIINSYAKSWGGILKYIEEQISDPVNQAKARKTVTAVREAKEKNRRLGKYSNDACFGYALLYVFKQVVGGYYMHGGGTKGIGVRQSASPIELEYEQAAEAEAMGAPITPMTIV